MLVVGALAMLLLHKTLQASACARRWRSSSSRSRSSSPRSVTPRREGPAWAPYDAAKIAAAGKPAVLDFSASWCLPCLELDKKTFSDPRVREALSRRGLYKADMTKAAAADTVALSDKYAILGVPTVIFLDASGQERKDLRLVGFEGPDEFLKRIEKAPRRARFARLAERARSRGSRGANLLAPYGRETTRAATGLYAGSRPSFLRASLAALRWASRLEGPLPREKASPSQASSTTKAFSWSGPDSSTTR